MGVGMITRPGATWGRGRRGYPPSATAVKSSSALTPDNAVVRADNPSGTTPRNIQSSSVTVDDSGNVTVSGSARVYFRDANAYVYSDSASSIIIAAATTTTIGVAGDIVLGDSTLRKMYPSTDRKMDLGDSTHRFASLFMGGGGVIESSTSGGLQFASDGTHLLGWWGNTPVAQDTGWNVTNLTTDRTYDADATSTAELADVLGTLINTLQLYGLLG